MSGGALIFSILMFLKKFPFRIENSTWFDYHIWLDVKIKLLVSIWNVKLVWNELSSSSSSLQCKDKQLRLLIVYNKIDDLPKISYQMCNIKKGSLLWAVYVSTLRNVSKPYIIKNYTELSTTNQAIDYQEACFSTIKYSFGISLKKKYVSAMCFYTTSLGFTMTLLNWQPFFKELLNWCYLSIRCTCFDF